MVQGGTSLLGEARERVLLPRKPEFVEQLVNVVVLVPEPVLVSELGFGFCVQGREFRDEG